MKFLLIGGLLLWGINSYGQKTSAKVAVEICKCIESKLPHTEQKNIKDSIDQCFGKHIATNMIDLKNELEIKSFTVESIFLMKEKVLTVLRTNCIYYKD